MAFFKRSKGKQKCFLSLFIPTSGIVFFDFPAFGPSNECSLFLYLLILLCLCNFHATILISQKPPKDKDNPTSSPVWLDVGLEAGSVLTHVSQSTIHTMALSVTAWGQTGLRDAERIIFNHYIICNDTHEALRLGQVNDK